MNMKIGWRTVVLVLSSLVMTVGFSACGSSDQSNPPLVPTGSAGSVELVSSSLQYDASGTQITGSITTMYTDPLTATATLSGFSASVTGCTVNTVNIGTSDTVTYTDNNNVVSNVSISLSAACSATSVTLNATETNDVNVTATWSTLTSVSASSDIISPITNIIADAATQNVVLTTNNEARTLVLKVWDINNAPVTSGSISVRYPSEVLNGVDVGSMSPVTTATIVDGEAIFNYTGPSDLSGLVSSGITGTTFVFYDTNNPTTFVSVPITYNPDTTVPPAVLTGYEVELIGSKAQPTANLENIEAFTLSVTDDKGNLLDNTDVNVTIVSNQTNLAQFLDVAGNEVSSISVTETNPVPLRLQTYRIAGLASFDIQLQIRDANGAIGDLNVTKAITIFSGPATAISVHYANTTYDAETAIFYDNMVVRLADKWDNPVNTHPKIFVSGIAGYKSTPITPSGVGNDYLIDANKSATMTQDAIGAKLTTAGGIDLSDVDVFNDVLLSYGDDYKFHASGKWDIDSIVGNDIYLKDTFNSSTPVDSLSFAIGRNYRNDLCTNDKYLLNVDSTDGTYEVNSDGIALVDVSYEPRAVGETVMINVNVLGMVNELGDEMRLGEVEGHTLRGHGLSSSSYNIGAGATGTVVFAISVIDTPEFLRSARFSYLPETSGTVTATCTSSSDTKADQYSTTACTSWISCTFDGGINGGSINIKDVVLGSEF